MHAWNQTGGRSQTFVSSCAIWVLLLALAMVQPANSAEGESTTLAGVAIRPDAPCAHTHLRGGAEGTGKVQGRGEKVGWRAKKQLKQKKSEAPGVPLEPPMGTRDAFPEDHRVRSWLFAHFRAVARLFGFLEYDAPVLEVSTRVCARVGGGVYRVNRCANDPAFFTHAHTLLCRALSEICLLTARNPLHSQSRRRNHGANVQFRRQGALTSSIAFTPIFSPFHLH